MSENPDSSGAARPAQEPGAMQLRPHQVKIMTDVNQCRRSGIRRLLVVSPTGSGKTVAFCHMTWRYYSNGKRVQIVVHRRELLMQISATLKVQGVPHGIIAAGFQESSEELVQICLVLTLAKRLARLEAPHLLIVDEAHHSVSKTYTDIFVHFQSSITIGFTATPERLDGSGLGDIYHEMILGPEVSDLMQDELLSRAKYFAPPPVADYTGVGTTGGDYNQTEAETVMCRADVTGDCVEHYQRFSPSQPAIAFCVSIRHSEMVSESFRAAGVPAAVLHSGLTAEARVQAVRDLAEGRILVLTSCDIVNEGFDVPRVTTAILLRKTQSLGLHLQQIGRVLRPHPGKSHAIILDHVGNLLTHGCAEDKREWSLESQKRRKSSPSTAACVQCPECFAVHPRAPQCPECGYVRPAPPVRGKVISDEELREFRSIGKLSRQDLDAAVSRCMSRKEVAALGKAQGYKPGWAFFRWRELCKQNQKSKLPSGLSAGGMSDFSGTPQASASAGDSPSDTASPARAGRTFWDGRLSA